MTGPVSGAVDAYTKINQWMSPMGSVIDEIMRPIVEPLAEPLEFVTGDPEGLEAAAQLWRRQAVGLREVVADQRRDRAALAHDWQGEAAERFLQELAEYETALEAEADDMDATAELLDEAAAESRMAQDLVETVIRELIEWAIITLAASIAFSVVTAGISLAAEAAAAATEGAVATTRIARLVAKLAKVLRRIEEELKDLKEIASRPHLNPKKPWTWNKPIDVSAYLAKKGTKMIGKAALHGIGLTGDPVGQTVQQAVQSGAGIVADEIDDRIAGNPHPSTAARTHTGIAQPRQEPELTPEERKARFDAAFG
ncbi:WXG100 family type VII secretion target [Kitasatospora sp. DSM 101779]|uniref:WXG100 family type VII secretion target n=1 Tax=Kitasatospora sp. DSM 101779 TaxID=2853165 RepID=UPI0021DA5539|nr:WXG100 family type VII secretion target [Kitasatospora sp. DSM 101779]MCU7825414.1 WXG100 family type VII secretion target [Kitasatospora sp. DSM 101779]